MFSTQNLFAVALLFSSLLLMKTRKYRSEMKSKRYVNSRENFYIKQTEKQSMCSYNAITERKLGISKDKNCERNYFIRWKHPDTLLNFSYAFFSCYWIMLRWRWSRRRRWKRKQQKTVSERNLDSWEGSTFSFIAVQPGGKVSLSENIT